MVAAIVVMSTVMSVAASQTRLDARTLNCKDLQNLVRREGGVVLTTSDFRFDRFVASRRYCLPGEMTVPALTQAADKRRCRVGYHCVIREPGNGS